MLENWSEHVEAAWTQILRPTKLRLRANQRGRGQTLVTKSVPPVRSPRNPHDWDPSKLKVRRGENVLSVFFSDLIEAESPFTTPQMPLHLC